MFRRCATGFLPLPLNPGLMEQGLALLFRKASKNLDFAGEFVFGHGDLLPATDCSTYVLSRIIPRRAGSLKMTTRLMEPGPRGSVPGFLRRAAADGRCNPGWKRRSLARCSWLRSPDRRRLRRPAPRTPAAGYGSCGPGAWRRFAEGASTTWRMPRTLSRSCGSDRPRVQWSETKSAGVWGASRARVVSHCF